MTAPVEHPAWCHQPDCTITPDGTGGAHLSLPVTIAPGPYSVITTRVLLYQGAPVDRYPESAVTLVILEFEVPDFGPGTPACEFGVSLRGEAALAVARVLATHARQAGGAS